MNRLMRTPLWLFIGTIFSFILLSPKWLIPAAGWIAPALMLLLVKDRKPVQTFLWSFGALYISGLVANFLVIPFPTPFLLIMMVQMALIGALPYLLYRALARRLSESKAIIAFPVIMVVYEYLSSFGGGGTWGSIAYSQVNTLSLMQLASITGLWGISFLVYWFNSLLYFVLSGREQWTIAKMPAIAFAGALGMVLLYGTIRLNPVFQYTGRTVRVAAITGLNLEPLLSVYQEVFHKPLDVDPNTLTPSSPELAELKKGLAAFIEAPMKYPESLRALVSYQDSLFVRAAREAEAGAKLICFSEGLMFTVKPVEEDLLRRGKAFAKHHQVRLLLTVGSFLPGKVEFGKKYIENKAIMINEAGKIENVFFKNKPVPVVEGSIAGDGEVPVIATEHGRIATSICYDADFPYLIRKAGEQEADILLLPSGDWREVAPYHADMARVRAIENGFSMVRPVSGATTITCDYNGRVIGRRDFYDDGDRVLVSNVPTNGIATLYSSIGDVFAWGCILTACYLALAFFPVATKSVSQPAN
jgi:apolipoprotein N-acyltransferase